MQIDLSGKLIIVTGTFGTVGAAMVDALSREGAVVVAIDKASEAAAPRFAPSVHVFAGIDTADSMATEWVAGEVSSLDIGVYGLLNVAGAFRFETVGDGSIATWDLLYNVNLRTAVIASHTFLPALRATARSTGHARIVNIGANASQQAAKGMGAYAASKAGVAKLTEALAAELSNDSITVNALLPTVVDTPANRRDMPNERFSAWVTPAQLTDVALFILSERSAAINGALLVVRGGL
jgi:NAD(P)-dependent dehydrogenase (short-subunit alcohol dehydrogenase family)